MLMGKRRKRMPGWRGFGLPIGKTEWAGTVLCGILAGLCIGFALLIIFSSSLIFFAAGAYLFDTKNL